MACKEVVVDFFDTCVTSAGQVRLMDVNRI